METADSTSTLQNSLQPSRPCCKYQECPCICRASQILASCFPPAGVENFGWKFILVTPVSFFSFGLHAPRCRTFLRFLWALPDSARCHYTPHKAARHADRRWSVRLLEIRNHRARCPPFARIDFPSWKKLLPIRN